MKKERSNFNLFQPNNLVPVVLISVVLYILFASSIGQQPDPLAEYECLKDTDCTPIENCPQTCILENNFEVLGTGCNPNFECECRCDLIKVEEKVVLESSSNPLSVLQSTSN